MPKHLGFQRKNECRAFIRSHYGKMTRPEMADQLKISRMTLSRLINELGLGNTYRPKVPVVKKHGGQIFNVHVYKNWLVGAQ